MKSIHTSSVLFAHAIVAGLLGILGGSAACNTSPAAPTPPAAAATIPTVNAVSPSGGLAGDGVRITVTGAGFVSGTTLTLGGAEAKVTAVLGGVITAITPVHAAGTVDVLVTNPDGRTGMLAGGYTYQSVTLP